MKRLIVILPLVAFACEVVQPEEPQALAQHLVADAGPSTDEADAGDDPYLWLEDVTGDKSLAWVKDRNAESKAALETDRQRELQKKLLAIYDSQDRLPSVVVGGEYLYNFWQDADHVRGLWRRTTLAEYRKPQPSWETVLDVDALATSENENWVWKAATWLEPSFDRALLSLSRGGGDAVVVREFDVPNKKFVTDGFNIPEAKTDLSWKDKDAVFVGTDFGEGSLTTSGYPRITKEWKRGTPLTEAKTLFEGQPEDVEVYAERNWHQGRSVDLITRSISFFESEVYILEGDKVEKLNKPSDAEVSFFEDQVLFRAVSDWKQNDKTWPSGSLLSAPLAAYRGGQEQLQAVFTPTSNRILQSFGGTKSAVILNLLEDVQSRILMARYQNGMWLQSELPGEGLDSVSVSAYDDVSDKYWLSSVGFLTPQTLALGDLSSRTPAEIIRSGPKFFDASGLEVTQHFAVSKDGTRVPYFQVAKKDLALNGDNPVYLTGYGGFELSQTPSYSGPRGVAWLERGGVYVMANIRGGGEYGPAWHEAALKQNRQRAYDDFIAIGEDLIARRVTRPERLGIQGGSNGGLLVGVMLTERPDLWGAVVCSSPLLDMKRYHLLLAGASWIGEYGDPDVPEEWAAIAKYSPYQNVQKDKQYPPVFFDTSTVDDRVHPGHARKMAAKMIEQGHSALFYENTDGGHAGGANNQQNAYRVSVEYEFMYQKLKL